MRIDRLLVVAAVAAALAGCSSTAPEADTTAPDAPPSSAEASTAALVEATTPTTPTPSGDVIGDAAAKIGCTGYAQSSDPVPSVDEWGTCAIDGQKVQIYQITGDDAYSAFLASVEAYGVTEAWLVRSGDVVVAPSDQTQIDAIRAKLNG